jgi:hypothetical protein
MVIILIYKFHLLSDIYPRMLGKKRYIHTNLLQSAMWIHP